MSKSFDMLVYGASMPESVANAKNKGEPIDFMLQFMFTSKLCPVQTNDLIWSTLYSTLFSSVISCHRVGAVLPRITHCILTIGTKTRVGLAL